MIVHYSKSVDGIFLDWTDSLAFAFEKIVRIRIKCLLD